MTSDIPTKLIVLMLMFIALEFWMFRREYERECDRKIDRHRNKMRYLKDDKTNTDCNTTNKLPDD